MINRIAKTFLFYLAYAPLFIIFVFQTKGITLESIVLSVLIFLSSVMFVWALLRIIKTFVGNQEEVCIINNKNGETVSFIVTYIIPFAIPLSGMGSVVSFSLLFLMIYYLYLETNLFCINPLLKIIFGFNIYDIELGHKKAFLLTKSKLSSNGITLSVSKLTDEVYMGAKI
jgi:hypothetical protein